MAPTFRLTFKAEVQPGQHPAVVRKRLAAALQLDEERLDLLFSGRAVIIKKGLDAAQAERFRALFEKAGAQLRVESEAAQPPPAGMDLQLLPPGADVLTAAERVSVPAADIDTARLSLAAKDETWLSSERLEQPVLPDTAHLSVAELGALMCTKTAQASPSPPVEPLECDLAAPGALMDTRERPAPPPAPDTHHLRLVD